MPQPRRKPSSTAEKSEEPLSSDEIALKLVELLTDETVIGKLRSALYPQVLADKIDTLTAKISNLHERLEKKDQYIETLEKRLAAVEANNDRLEQYSRRCNVRIQGIEEIDSEDITAKVMAIVNDTMALTPPVTNNDIVTSHRLGPKPAAGERPRSVIVQFTCARLRDAVLRSRQKLRSHGSVVFVNEDLTKHRAQLASKTRRLKKEHKISDCWTYNGRVMVKSVSNDVREVHTDAELSKY